MLNYKKYIFFYNNNINKNNIYYYLVLDKKFFNYIYILYNKKNKNIINYRYILNNIYILFFNNNLFYLLNKIYKYSFYNIYSVNNNFKLILTVIGINYKFYYLKKYNILIFKLKYNHKIIIKLPNIVLCNIYINRNIIELYSYNLFILNSIGKLINSFQFINKYKELGIKLSN
ncbi:apicoplast ribosomal protein L6 (apicoplast) [Plasmodium berghei]|uniref:Apicoplast ribosomal protein L6 n=2 Tax=Plasmodium berghei TaxID=5821 RepID=A0A509AW24_PLABA|nr:apicoplast ribosomal protein L6 [Plasmodium berghei]VUC58757.1 apicoplast ribosomal protein L6 [Plasmodium berghei ANKA]SCL99428.1 apicoplast ribosomal protein L6 [Plasmodium berghei]SCM16946.1 apicoplast ribosomal protein L6 [Plasmodium berghei]SCM18740.1 apicoplast ribosomal protein L6 [Plasmodium berghei]|eukprot:YP_009273035.1 apicoplast ribosomal protein L6 (apicoplast) [Plasmodium berghei]